MKHSIVTIIVVAASAAVLNTEIMDFTQFIAAYGKTYASVDEYNSRLKTFTANLAKIKAFNSETSTVGVNKLTDMTAFEYKKMLGFLTNQTRTGEVKVMPRATADSVDWRTVGAVTPVKD